MRSRPPIVGSLTVAAILAALTLGVFWILRDFGPESALRRFHQAALNGRVADLQAVTVEPVVSPSVKELVASVQRTFQRGGQPPRVARTERMPRLVRSVLLYQVGGDVFVPAVWVVRREKAGWKVSASETLLATRALSQPEVTPKPAVP